MRHSVKETANEIALSYQWKHQYKWNSIKALVENTAQSMVLGSEEEFIAEHYWGYSKYNEATTFEYNVQHPAWKIFPVKDHLIDCDFKTQYGDTFSNLTNIKPNSVFVAKGSDIAVLKKRTL